MYKDSTLHIKCLSVKKKISNDMIHNFLFKQKLFLYNEVSDSS